MKKLRLGISSCPNDTFIFYALLNGKIEHNPFEFNLHMADVEELNLMAVNGELDLTKLSYNAYYQVWREYQLFNSGSALGRGNGPLLISKRKIYMDEVPYISIAIPGENTTANMLLDFAFPSLAKKKVALFSDIEDMVLSNEEDAGLIIHESRFTYQKKGLKKIIDLGSFWEEKTNLPIPLGGIAVKRSFSEYDKQRLDALIRQSIDYAFKHPEEAMSYVKRFSQSMEEEVMLKHINLYVNLYSVDLGDEGRKSVAHFLSHVARVKSNVVPEDLFVKPVFPYS